SLARRAAVPAPVATSQVYHRRCRAFLRNAKDSAPARRRYRQTKSVVGRNGTVCSSQCSRCSTEGCARKNLVYNICNCQVVCCGGGPPLEIIRALFEAGEDGDDAASQASSRTASMSSSAGKYPANAPARGRDLERSRAT